MQWGVITVLAKGGSLVLLGQYAYAMAIIAPALTFINLNLRAVQVADWEGRFRFADYFGLRITSTVTGCLLFPLIGLFVPSAAGGKLSFAAIGLFRSLEGLMDFTHGWFQKSRRMQLISRSMLIRVALSLASFTTIVVLWHSLAGGISAMALVLVSVVFFHDFPLIRKSESFRTAPLRDQSKLAITCLPLTVGLVLNSFQANGPKLILTHYKGVEELGVFAALTYLAAVVGTVVAAVGAVASPRLAEWYAQGRVTEIKGLLHRMLCFDAFLALFLLLLFGLYSKPIFNSLLSVEVARFSSLGIWIAGAASLTFLESHVGVVATSINLLKQQVPIQAFRVVITMGLAQLLIPSWGVLGAIWSLAASTAITSVLYYVMCLMTLKRRREFGPVAQAVPFEKDLSL